MNKQDKKNYRKLSKKLRKERNQLIKKMEKCQERLVEVEDLMYAENNRPRPKRVRGAYARYSSPDC